MLALWTAVTFRRLAVTGEAEGRTGDAYRGCTGDDLQAFDHVLDDLVFEPGVHIFGVLTEDYHVDIHILVARLHTRHAAHRTDVRVEVEALAQRHVNTRKAAGDGRGDWTLEAEMGPFQRFNDMRREHLARLLNDVPGQFGTLPGNIHARSGYSADRSVGHFGPDTIPRNQRNSISHFLIIGMHGDR